MNTKSFILLIIILAYNLLFKFILIFKSDIYYYIINPLIWITFFIISIIIYYKLPLIKKNTKRVIYTTFGASLIYIILFYSFGMLTGYGNNPFTVSKNWIIINFFSILLIIIIKEFIKNFLIITIKKYKILNLILITFIFIMIDLNLVNVIDLLKNVDNIIFVLLKYIVPVVATNIFFTYLIYKGGSFPSIIYQVIIITPQLIIPIIPNYDYIYLTLFDLLFPIFTFLILESQIEKDIKNRYLKPIKPSRWILLFISSILLLMFALGAFTIRPYVILSGSMSPIINQGDIILIKKCDINNVNLNQIVEYKYENFHIIHRVVKINHNKDGIELTLKGDNNIMIDKNIINKENFGGCYVNKIPYLGYPAYIFYDIFSNQNINDKQVR